jgi:predicted TIM-barrel fold metal-dependent hydrolase
MITDVQTRCWASPEQLGDELSACFARRGFGRTPASHEEAHLDACERAEVAFVLGARSGRLGVNVAPDWIAQLVRRRPDRLVGVAGIDPLLPSWRDDLERAVSLGLKAVTVSPSVQGYHPAHTAAMGLWAECERQGLPVLITRFGPLPPNAMLEHDRPFLWDEVFRAFPRLTAVFGGLGSPFLAETLALLEKHERVFADVAQLGRNPIEGYRALAAASAAGTLGKLLFASGFPAETPAEAIERLFELNAFLVGLSLPTIPQAQIRGIVERDACSLLGIALPAGAGRAARLGAGRPMLGGSDPRG